MYLTSDDNYGTCPKCKGKAVKLFFSLACDVCDSRSFEDEYERVWASISIREKQWIDDENIEWLKSHWLRTPPQIIFTKNHDDAVRMWSAFNPVEMFYAKKTFPWNTTPSGKYEGVDVYYSYLYASPEQLRNDLRKLAAYQSGVIEKVMDSANAIYVYTDEDE